MKNWYVFCKTKLKDWHAFGTLARLLARWQVIMRSWHAFCTLARGQVDHAGMHGTYARDLANSHTLFESIDVTMKTTTYFYDMTTLHYSLLLDHILFVIVYYWTIFCVSGG